MPTYQYACKECGHNFETVQSFSEDSLTECPECTGVLRKLFSAVGIVFKGSGFYRTDNRTGSGGNGSADNGSSSGSSDSSSSAGSSSESSSGSSDSGSSNSGSSDSGSSGGSSSGNGSSGAQSTAKATSA